MQNNSLADLSLQQLKRAVAIREKVEGLEKELNRITGGRISATTSAAPKKKGRFSAAARAKLSAAMKARWARRKGRKRGSSRSRLVAKARRRVGNRAKAPSRRAPLKEGIIHSLKAAGKSGVTVKDMAAKLGTGYGNVSVWFHTTAKGVKEIKKVAPGRFAWAS